MSTWTGVPGVGTVCVQPGHSDAGLDRRRERAAGDGADQCRAVGGEHRIFLAGDGALVHPQADQLTQETGGPGGDNGCRAR